MGNVLVSLAALCQCFLPVSLGLNLIETLQPVAEEELPADSTLKQLEQLALRVQDDDEGNSASISAEAEATVSSSGSSSRIQSTFEQFTEFVLEHGVAEDQLDSFLTSHFRTGAEHQDIYTLYGREHTSIHLLHLLTLADDPVTWKKEAA